MQIKKSPEVHDVLIIGSGASGGMAAWNLTRKGVNVLMVDAGTKFNRAQFWSHVKPWEDRSRRAAGMEPPKFYIDTKLQPYTYDKGNPFDLVRVWGRGGKQMCGAVFRCVIRMSTLPDRSTMDGRSPGPSGTKTLRLTTIKWTS